MSLFINRFRELTEKSGKMQKEICMDMGISKQKFTKWKTGYTEPHLDDVILIADYFGVTTDYLLGYTNADGTKNPDIINSFNNNQNNTVNVTIKK